MAFEAYPVTKERWPDLVEMFDRPVVRTCFCMFYRKTGTGTGVGRENRQAMKALVDRGTVPGLIGYEDGVPVAWVSLGPREDYAKLRQSPVMKPVDDRPVWSIVCFFVDRRARGRGLSERMLRAAVDYARSCGARSPCTTAPGSGRWPGGGPHGRWCERRFGPDDLGFTTGDPESEGDFSHPDGVGGGVLRDHPEATGRRCGEALPGYQPIAGDRSSPAMH
jgi:GNAT superfamily N-acetyltransferase